MESPPAESSAALIEWSTITEKVECPLCLYNLRGLAEPRCPECGFTFDWAEVLDPQRQRHPYLFEHYPHRNFWSFGKTLLAGLLTRRFWTTLKPTHIVHPRRLVIYWLLCTCLSLLAPAAKATQFGVNLSVRNAWERLFPVPRPFPNPQARQQYLDTNFPLPPSKRFFSHYWQLIRFIFLYLAALEVGTIMAWPWLTFAALMVFQTSMKKAKVQRAHVLRCVIYASDACAWYGILTLCAVTWLAFQAVTKRSPQETEAVTFWLLLLLWVVRLDRLVSGYRKYLRFDHSFWTALASQIIVLLSMGAILFWGARVVAMFS